MIGEDRIYIAFYKPYGVLTAFTDEEGRDTLKTYIDVPGIYSVGRLDMDSEGLLLLTNDGALAHRLTDPRFNHPKTYLVQVEGQPTPDALVLLAGGIEIKGQKTRKSQVIQVPEPDLPARAKPVTPHGPTAWLRMVLREGKKHQIRHMTAAVGLPALRLVRVAMGPIALNDLQPGEWRYLSPAEVEALQNLAVRPAVRPAKDRSKPGAIKQTKPTARQKPSTSANNTRGSRYRNGGRRSSNR